VRFAAVICTAGTGRLGPPAGPSAPRVTKSSSGDVFVAWGRAKPGWRITRVTKPSSGDVFVAWGRAKPGWRDTRVTKPSSGDVFVAWGQFEAGVAHHPRDEIVIY
jgi:hypothetical protein